MLRPLETLRSSSLRAPLQVSADALDGPRTRVAAVPKIENKTRIPNGFPAESSWGSSILTQKLFHLSEQMHLSCPYKVSRLGCSFLPNAFPTCLGSFLSVLRGH